MKVAFTASDAPDAQEALASLKKAYPNAGFHANVIRQMAGWFIRHPLDPAPMLKW